MMLNLSHLRTIPCGLSSSPQKVHCFTEEPPLVPLSKHHWSFIEFETGWCIEHDEFPVMTGDGSMTMTLHANKTCFVTGSICPSVSACPTSTGRVSIWCINVLKLSANVTPKTGGTIDSPKVDTYDLWAWNSVSNWTSFMVYVNIMVGEILVYSIPQNGNPTKNSLRCTELSVVAFRKWRPNVTCLQESLWRYLLLLVRWINLQVAGWCIMLLTQVIPHWL